jgi:hypothetical protein
MAITQLGLHGPQTAYGTFSAKAEEVLAESTTVLMAPETPRILLGPRR